MENTMKIGNSPEAAAAPVGTDKPAAAQTGRAQPQGPTQAGGAKKAPEASAQIELSSTATKLLSGVSEEGSFDAEKVGRISQAIAEGKFSVNADAIADKLIANAQELLSRTQTH
jgi:negative regulator of flagellin synthesis FlgM